MVTKVTQWVANDGTIFATEARALQHEETTMRSRKRTLAGKRIDSLFATFPKTDSASTGEGVTFTKDDVLFHGWRTSLLQFHSHTGEPFLYMANLGRFLASNISIIEREFVTLVANQASEEQDDT